MIAHIVLFKAKSSVGPDDIRLFALALTSACDQIPDVRRAMVGPATNAQGVGAFELGDQTNLFVAVLEFADQEALSRYLEHPAHRELAELFWKYCESTLIVDASLGPPGGLLTSVFAQTT